MAAIAKAFCSLLENLIVWSCGKVTCNRKSPPTEVFECLLPAQ